ncbi:MAG: tryptophan synthase subunit beta like protein [Thioalkalispiraceae bacterium]
MPYVNRDKNGNIIALHSEPPREGAEKLSASDPQVMAFLQETESDALSQQFLSTSDIELARVLEDLITLLIEKNLITFTELPDAVQNKLINRKQAREILHENEAQLIKDNDIL